MALFILPAIFIFIFWCVCVCLFSGNYEGERPYEQGTPCSSCPSNKTYCEGNLCTQQASTTEALSPPTTEVTTEPPSPPTTEANTEASLPPTTEPPSPTTETTTEAPTLPVPIDSEVLSYYCRWCL